MRLSLLVDSVREDVRYAVRSLRRGSASGRCARPSARRRGGQLVGLGLVVGAPLAAALCWVMTATLFGVVRPNAVTLLGISALLLLTAAVALWVPAWQASRLDPVDALRRE